MVEDQAKRLAKRKNDLPGNKKSSDGWTYQAAKVAGAPGGWAVQRKRPEGFGWTTWRTSAD